MKRVLICLGILAALWAQTAWAETGKAASMLSLGQAPLGANEAAARDQAVADALKRAVGQAAVGMVDPPTLSSKLHVLDSQILAKAKQFVAAYTLKASSIQQGKVLALVSVSIDRASLDKALAEAGLRLPAAKMALTLALISQEAAPGRPPVFWWSGAPGMGPAPPLVLAVIKSLGVKLADTTALAGRIPLEARQPVLTEEQALEMARLAGADLVVLGRVRTFPLMTPKGESPPPLAQLEALDVKQGKVLAQLEEEGPIFHTTPGPEAGKKVDSAVQDAVRKLLEQAAGADLSTPGTAGELELIINGLRSLGDLNNFEQVLGSLSALVSDMRRESVGPGWANLRLKLNGPPSQLADQLLLQNFGEFMVNVVEIAPKRLKLELIPR